MRRLPQWLTWLAYDGMSGPMPAFRVAPGARSCAFSCEVLTRCRAPDPSPGADKAACSERIVLIAEKAQSSGPGGVAPNPIPPHVILRTGGENCLARDVGACSDRISIFGRGRNIRSLAHADVWGAAGTFKVPPRLWRQI